MTVIKNVECVQQAIITTEHSSSYTKMDNSLIKESNDLLFLQYCAFSENIRFLNSDACKAVQFDFTGEELRLPNVRR